MKNQAKNIILLHGWEARVERLRPLQSELSGLGWHVLNLKLPGFDLAPPQTPWNLDEYKDYVLTHAKKTWSDEPYAVFGHSFGGRIAIWLAATNTKNLSGLVLCTPGGLSRPSLIKRAPLWLLAKIGKLIFYFIPGSLAFKKALYKVSREHDYEKTQGVMRQVFKRIVTQKLKPKLKEINVPTLLLWGTADKMTPFEDALMAQKLLPKAELVSFDHIGHRLPYEKPQKLAQEIDQWFGR